ncbi:MAG: S-layer homology domain-containing protein [Clostridia bacterium]|nr:S-layer homology domain-containing protein [Clostridia bacterium]
MKKIYISLILIIVIVLGISSTSFAAQFYDTIGTKYESPTEILYTLGIVDGTSENVFSANRPVTRAEMAKMILNVYNLGDSIKGMSKGINNFKDVKKNAWYYDYVNVAADIKMINGYSDGTFRPNDEVTYSEAVAMIIRALGYTELSARLGESWDAPYIRKANEIRLNKNAGYFKYTDDATRGNVAIMLCNMLNSESYIVVKDKTNVGLIKETTPKKVINRYYSDYAIIDEDILEDIQVYREKVNNEEVAEYYISTKEIDLVQVPDPIPLKRIGVKVSGMYNIDENMAIGLNFIYDEDFDEGAIAELEDIYDLNSTRKNTYTLGKNSNYAYIYFDNEERISRMTYLGSNEDILVKESKIEKEKYTDGGKEKTGAEYILINEENKILTSKILINEDGELLEWSDVKENGVISSIGNDMYVYHDKTIKGQLQKVKVIDSKLYLTIDEMMYECDDSATYKLYGSETTKRATRKALEEYIGRDIELIISYSKEVMEINLDRNYENASQAIRFGIVVDSHEFEGEETDKTLRLATTSGKNIFRISKDVLDKELAIGTLIHFEYDNSRIEFIDIFAENAKIPGGTVDMDLEKKGYEDGKLGEYELDTNTVIYILEKEYEVNSDKSIKDYHMRIEENIDVLENLEGYTVHVLYDEYNTAVAIFIEKELNKYDYKYGRVLDIYQAKNDDENSDEKYVLKIKVSPFNNVISEYTVSGNLNCEPGDLISYTTDDDKFEIEERYNAKLLGDKRDLIVKEVKKDIVYLTNGDQINLKENQFKINGKKYLFDKYVVVYSRVTKLSGDWKFYSATIVDPEDLKLQPGDRIAMDEIEDLFVVYRGYED